MLSRKVKERRALNRVRHQKPKWMHERDQLVRTMNESRVPLVLSVKHLPEEEYPRWKHDVEESVAKCDKVQAMGRVQFREHLENERRLILATNYYIDGKSDQTSVVHPALLGSLSWPEPDNRPPGVSSRRMMFSSEDKT